MKVDHEKLNAWLAKKWKGDHLCPICGSNDWVGLENYLLLSSSGIPSMIYPSVVIRCQECAYLLFFNAVTMGLLPGKEEVAEKREEG
jgi:hypothetical protein